MENDSNEELSHLEMRYLHRLLAGLLILNPNSEIRSVEIPGVIQESSATPHEFVMPVDPELYAQAFGLDDNSRPLKAELYFGQQHVIDEYPHDRPIPPQVMFTVDREETLGPETVHVNEWFVVCDPDAMETQDMDSYVGIEYSRPHGDKIILTNESFKDNPMEALWQDLDRSRRLLTQDDAMHLQNLAHLIEHQA